MPAVSFLNRVLESGTIATSSASTTTTAVASVSVGDCLFVAFRGGFGIYASSMSDSVGNTYNLIKASTTTTSNTTSLYYTIVSTPITTSTVVTVNFSGSNASATYAIFGASFRNVDPINPIGSSAEANLLNAVTSISFTSPAAKRFGSMLLAVPTVNDGVLLSVTAGTITRVATTITDQNWMHFGYRQLDNLSGYSLTYQKSTGTAGNWSYVVAEINRAPSDMLATF